MRGKATHYRRLNILDRITPACAGKRTSDMGTIVYVWDHPRVCGEKPDCFFLRKLLPGSPPRVRGKDRYRNRCSGCFWDHPRVCGEKLFTPISNRNFRGSPPRVRGKEAFAASVAVNFGITLACAGKSQCGGVVYDNNRDHPRVCGEKAKQIT